MDTLSIYVCGTNKGRVIFGVERRGHNPGE